MKILIVKCLVKIIKCLNHHYQYSSFLQKIHMLAKTCLLFVRLLAEASVFLFSIAKHNILSAESSTIYHYPPSPTLNIV
jgi:hypothetical protein